MLTVTVSAPAKGPAELTLRNRSQAPVTAYAYTVTYTVGDKQESREETWDSALLLTAPALGPNEAAVRRIVSAGGTVSVEVKAVTYAGGSGSGDAASLQRIMARRRFALATIDGLQRALPLKREDMESRQDAELARTNDTHQKDLVKAYYGMARANGPRDLELLRVKLEREIGQPLANQ